MTLFDPDSQRMLSMLPRVTFPSALFVGSRSLMALRCIKNKKIFILTSKTIEEKFGDELLDLLKENKVTIETHSGEPTEALVEKFKKKIQANSLDLLVGVGGGSVLDLVKAIKNDLGIELLVIPTTIGTGSETTRFALLLDEHNHKKVLDSERMLPDAVIFNPKFLGTLPKQSVIEMAFDGFSHALEGITSKATTNFVKLFGPALADEYYEILLELSKTDDLSELLLERLQYLGFLSGFIQGSASVGLMHGLAHNLGPIHKLSHARAIMLFFMPVLKYNATQPETYHVLSRCRNLNSENIIEKLEALFKSLSIDYAAEIKKLNIDLTDDLVASIKTDICTRTNPCAVDEEVIRGIINGGN